MPKNFILPGLKKPGLKIGFERPAKNKKTVHFGEESAGLTLVELLVVLGIVFLIAVTSPIYGNLQVSGQTKETSFQIVQFLREAREQSVAGQNSARHGVKFEEKRYILYQGSSYASRQSEYDREINLNSSLTLSWSLAGGSDEVNFLLGYGTPNSTGTVTVSHSAGGQRDIFVNSFGMIDIE